MCIYSVQRIFYFKYLRVAAIICRSSFLWKYEALHKLPADPRTLSSTCRKVQRIEMGERDYYRFGVGKQITENGPLFTPAGEELKVGFGVNELPISN